MKTTKHTSLAILLFVAPITLALAEEPPIDPVPRAVKSQVLHTWDFQQDTEGWVAESQCSLAATGGVLQIQAMGGDPYFHLPVDLPGGQVVLELKVRSSVGTAGSVFWTTDQQPRRGEDKRSDFEIPDNGQWLVTRTRFTAPGRLTDLRIDPGTKPGLIEIDSIRVIREQLHPLSVSRITQSKDAVQFEVTNHQDTPVTFTSDNKEYTLPGTHRLTISKKIVAEQPLESVSLTLLCNSWPPVRRTTWVVNPGANIQWLERPFGTATLSVARDGSAAIVRQGGQIVASIGPLVMLDGQLPDLKLGADGPEIRFRSSEVSVTISVDHNEISVAIDSDRLCEGPVVRVLGELQQGLFAGLEYLGKGERSSSTLDIETPEHIRYAPDPLKVTMPLMAFVTDRATVAVTWNDMTLQPIFATPNFFDGTNDHRMTLQGKSIRATIRAADGPLEESIAWAVTKAGLPDLPPAPRTKEQQHEICLAALNGPLHTDKGWGHCVQERWQRQPFSDMASTMWRLGGKVPEIDRFAYGGAHVPNGTIYFVTGHAQQWLDIQRQQVRNFIRRQQPDGSYRYAGKYARGHFEDTASGVSAMPAARLLEFAYITGDQEALQAGLRTLEYMKRFHTPRGAQVWECALHTPDQLASAYLVWAYARGFQLTGNQDYLQQARKWALSGLPFTYLWSNYPIMGYSTPPVYGATNWSTLR